MTLRREEASTHRRYGRAVHFSVSVLVCDHRGDDDPVKCDATLLIGIGEGDSLTTGDIRDATESGWSVGDHDYCPDHAAEHADD